jgi:hypothetical protein
LEVIRQRGTLKEEHITDVKVCQELVNIHTITVCHIDVQLCGVDERGIVPAHLLYRRRGSL